MDGWSDLDLRVHAALDRPLEDVVGRLWAYENAEHESDQVVRTVRTDGYRIDLIVTGARLAPPDVDTAANEVRFLLATAAAKLGRGDRLIGSHLVLDAARLCLVQAMQLRDRDEGTRVHRHGTARNASADDVADVLSRGWDLRTSPTVLDGVAALFDRWHSELDPRYATDWDPLRLLIERGRG